jgi:hypothetical protein
MSRQGQRRWIGAVVSTALLAGCTIEFGTPSASPTTVSRPDPSPSSVPTGDGSAAAAMAELCDVPAATGRGEPKPPGRTPAVVSRVEEQVEQVRGLTFDRPVAVEPVTAEQIERRLDANFDKTVPEELYARRSRAWATIGVIPAGTEISDALRAFQAGQVVGFYNPSNQALVYVGQDRLTTTSRFILAHELTHALDDQHFDLTRLDPLAAGCDDEAFMAGLGAVEGSAQAAATQTILRFPVPGEVFGGTDTGAIEDVPEFIVQTELWPYDAGMRFIDALATSGGEAAVDGALRHLPVSTEQVMHPERYPNDTPQPVDVPDLSSGLPGRWRDLDVMIVGEAWLDLMLGLRLGPDTAAAAAAGWDGGLYRAWTDGDRVAVVLRTVWDTPEDAQAFADALGEWISRTTGTVLSPTGSTVDAVFASDRSTLDAAREALAGA